MITYPIHERFATFQGEGIHMGVPAFFIRTYGCPVHCPWCDSAGTWHPKWIPNFIIRMTPKEITNEVCLAGMRTAVITGGEPAIHDMGPLCEELHEDNRRVHLETSGAFPIRGLFDWITLSPKKWKHPIFESVMLADEFKIIVEHPDDIAFYWDLLREVGLPETAHNPIWLHPEWSKRDDKAVLEAIVKQVKVGEGIFRAGWQLHKLYKVDALDKRSRPIVPLGGDESKGY